MLAITLITLYDICYLHYYYLAGTHPDHLLLTMIAMFCSEPEAKASAKYFTP